MRDLIDMQAASAIACRQKAMGATGICCQQGVAEDSGLPIVRPGDYDDALRYSSANDEYGIL